MAGPEDAPVTCDCGWPEGSFACRIRHQYLQTGWAQNDH